MRLTRLSLTNYRAFAQVEVVLPRGVVVLVGDNAQGKTSLLESVFFLAAFTSFQTSQDNQVVNFTARGDDIPVTRIVAEYERAEKQHKLEIRLILQGGSAEYGTGRLRKEILLDGIKKNAAAAVGHFNAVVFIPQMSRYIDNGPEERRRYLNLTLAQIVPGYADDLTRYTRGLTRRNALLKQLQEQGGDAGMLDYWDELLADCGSRLISARKMAVREISSMANPVHFTLTGMEENFSMQYLPALTQVEADLPGDTNELHASYLARLRGNHRVDIARGTTSIGPHRDDLRFVVNGNNLADFGSRGQVRTALQSLKLGELQWMKERTGEMPVMLLDETLAELDEHRRAGLLESLAECEQVLLTTTDLDLFTPDFLRSGQIWQVRAGEIEISK
jgi:DNA replication and repair protein RecF